MREPDLEKKRKEDDLYNHNELPVPIVITIRVDDSNLGYDDVIE